MNKNDSNAAQQVSRATTASKPEMCNHCGKVLQDSGGVYSGYLNVSHPEKIFCSKGCLLAFEAMRQRPSRKRGTEAPAFRRVERHQDDK
jgi:hypothetical protein